MKVSCGFLADLVTFTEEILNGKLHFLCGDRFLKLWTEFLMYRGYQG